MSTEMHLPVHVVARVADKLSNISKKSIALVLPLQAYQRYGIEEAEYRALVKVRSCEQTNALPVKRKHPLASSHMSLGISYRQ